MIARPKRKSLGLGVVLTALLLLTGCLANDVRYLASDELNGRNNNTGGSIKAQDMIVGYLEQWTEGADPTRDGRDAYKDYSFFGGTSLIGVLPGTDLADEYVMVGAHYDGLGNACEGAGAEDSICNGATDNATGVAVALNILRSFAFSGTSPRRSIIFAFWDREEDNLGGSRHYKLFPLIPLEDTVAYVNLDIQGANLRPSGANSTFAVGAETGGPMLVDAVAAAAAPGFLDTWQLSLIFGQGRSDHANLIDGGVPSVFFTDSTGPCYHSVHDEVDVVDFDKLEAQYQTAQRLVADLADRDDRPTLATGLPLATYEDAVVVATLFDRLLADLALLTPPQQTAFLGHLATVQGIVAAGPAAFDDAAMLAMLQATAPVVNDIVTSGPCDGFLDAP